MKISNQGPRITHLLFADDSLLFCKAEANQVQSIRDILTLYESCSGQKINLDKSSIFFSRNTKKEQKEAICEVLPGVTMQDHSKYLGLPLVLGRSKKSIFSYIKERVTKKIKSWKSKFLSAAGKEVLLKSVVQALPVYTMSCFRLPKGLCHELSKTIASFWWSCGEKEKRMHWIAWEKLSDTKENGGLGFKGSQEQVFPKIQHLPS